MTEPASQATPTPSSPVTPLAIERDGEDAIRIRWSDESESRWTAAALRKACPCATCREKKRGQTENALGTDTESSTATAGPIGLPVLSLAEAAPTRISGMRPVGVYAYNIAFSDGHSSGIFSFDLLRSN